MVLIDALRVLAAAAALASPSPTPSAPPEITHVVTSDRSDETLHNATRTTYVVTAAQIAQHGYRTIGDALANVPGVEVSRYGTVGSNVSYGIRGSSSSQVLVLVDGVPAPGALSNSVQFGTMSTSSVRRIEVVEGGGSTLYGTGAIGGIINVITDAQTKPEASVRYGTFDDFEVHAAADGFSVDRIAAKNAFDVRSNNDARMTTLRYGLDRSAGALHLSLRATSESDDLGTPGEIPFVSLTGRETDVNQLASLAVSAPRSQSDATLQLFGGRQAFGYDCDPADAAFCSVNTESRDGLSFRNAVHGATSRLVYGADLSRGIARGDDGMGDVATHALAQSAIYAQESWSFRGADVYAGLRGERDATLGGQFSPSFGVRTQFGEGLELRANLAGAFRAPNFSELYFPNYGNPNLLAERAAVGDVTLTDTKLLGGISAGWFTNYTKNLIEAVLVDPVNYIYEAQNVAQARMQGFTFSAQTRRLNHVRASLDATDLYEAENLTAQTRLPNDPFLSVTLGLDIDGGRTGAFDDAGISVRNVGRREFFNPSEPLYAQSDAYANVDAFTRWRIGSRTLLALRVSNLGNERYAQVSGYPMPGRAFSIELSTK